MRGPRIAAALALGLALHGSAAAAPTLAVRPVVPAADARHPLRAERAGAATLTPEEARAQATRIARWRARPDVVTGPNVDWSPWAKRRQGWQPPAWAGQPADRATRKPSAERGVGATTAGPDTLRIAMVRIDFATDRGGSHSTGNGRFDLSGPDPAVPPVDRPPHNATFYRSHLEALSRYYWEQSYGRVRIKADVWPPAEDSAYTVSDMADFGPWAFSRNIYPAAVHMFRTFLFAADSISSRRGQRIPWANYDRVILLHAGSDLQNDVRQDSDEDIPTFTIGVSDSDRVFFAADSALQGCDPGNPDTPCFNIDRAEILPETINQDDFFGAINGVIAHETGHLCFGFDDVYNIETGEPIVGEWSLMDSGNLVGSKVLLPDSSVIFATGLLPPSIDPWQRFLVGDALSFPEASVGDTILLHDSERFPQIPRVTLSSDELLLLENRFQLPANIVQLEQDPVTHVILGPRPDSLLYDALLPGSGVLVWHIDTSVLPFVGSLRINPDYGFNTNPHRHGISIIEADGLGDLGDLGSPYLLGAPTDPWFTSINPTLSDTTIPNLVTNSGTRPHRRIDFLDDPAAIMRLTVRRAWQLPGWPVAADFPPGGPRLLAVDADGDRNLDICWAGGADSLVIGGVVAPDPDSAALFAVKADGSKFNPASGSFAFAHLDRRPRPIMAALPLNDPGGGLGPAVGPSWFAASTYPAGPDLSTPGGRVWLVDTLGDALPGWPAVLPALVTTPPVILGSYPNAVVLVGCKDGRVYCLDLHGQTLASGGPLPAAVSGRLAVTGTVLSPVDVVARVAAGSADGTIGVLDINTGPIPLPLPPLVPPTWTKRVTSGVVTDFAPDFLWVDFDGATPAPNRRTACAPGEAALVVRAVDRLFAFCAAGTPLPGWGRSAGDSLVDGLAAGDIDGDGFPEVLTQTVNSRLAFWNATGAPSPGWPRAGTPENLRTQTPPLAVDVNGDGRCKIVGLNGSGTLAAFDGEGRAPEGWPLATGSGCAGDAVAADLDRDGTLEIVAPDRYGLLYAYSLPPSIVRPTTSPWTMVAGDPGRTAALPAARTTSAPAPSAGPLVKGSLKAFPNPARRKPVSFAFQLTEDAQVEFRILDTSGHEVASFSRAGSQSDNLVTWDPSGLPAGLYMARLRFHGAKSEGVEVLPVAVLR